MHRAKNDTLADAACGFHRGLFGVSLLRGRLVRPAMHRARNEGLAEVVRVFYRGLNGVARVGQFSREFVHSLQPHGRILRRTELVNSLPPLGRILWRTVHVLSTRPATTTGAMCGGFVAVYFACAVRRRFCAAFFFGRLYGVRQRHRSRAGGAEDENNTRRDTSVRCRVLVAVRYVTEFAGRRSRRRVEFSGRRSRVAGLSSLHGGAAAGLSSPGEPSSGRSSPGNGAAAGWQSRRRAESPGGGAAGRRSRRRAG